MHSFNALFYLHCESMSPSYYYQKSPVCIRMMIGFDLNFEKFINALLLEFSMTNRMTHLFLFRVLSTYV